MTHKDSASLLQRIETLERSNRTLRRGLGVALGGLALVALLGAAPALQKVEANKFSFRDDKGRVRISLDNAPTGPVCTVYNVSGQPGIRLYISNEGFVQFEDPSKKAPK